MLTVIFLASSALAQAGVGVSPPRTELLAAAGGQVTQVVDVDNPSRSSALDVNSYFNDAFMMPDGSIHHTAAGLNPRSLAPWTAVSPLSFGLQPAAQREVRYTISVPADARDGTYWSVLFFESQAPASGQPAEGYGITTAVRVGHIVYVTVGQPALAGNISSIRFDGSAAPGALRITFQNTGEGLLRLNGRAEIRTLSGELLQTLHVESLASFPDASHDLVLPLAETLREAEYIVLVVLDYGEATVITAEGRVKLP
jgi:hypothetical protein